MASTKESPKQAVRSSPEQAVRSPPRQAVLSPPSIERLQRHIQQDVEVDEDMDSDDRPLSELDDDEWFRKKAEIQTDLKPVSRI